VYTKNSAIRLEIRSMQKNITFSADDAAIERARTEALSRGTTLNVLVRKYIEELGRPRVDIEEFRAAVEAVRAQTAGKMQRMYTREEMNERR
jgi:hypothetical protein